MLIRPEGGGMTFQNSLPEQRVVLRGAVRGDNQGPKAAGAVRAKPLA